MNLLEHTGRISFEISNRCTYAHIHDRCPASRATIPKTLPSDIILRTLNYLNEEKYDKKICFHTYNEPLIDPRLLSFIRSARAACPDSDIFIYSNGFMLDQILLDELVIAGASSFRISAYTYKEYERLIKLKTHIQYYVERMNIEERWIERIGVYDLPEKDSTESCYAPLTDIQITHAGKIRLCCVDWKSKIIFGNLHHETLQKILPRLHEVYEKLSKGERIFPLCRRCGTRRRIR